MHKTFTTLLLCLAVSFCFGQSKNDKGNKRPNGIRAGFQWSNLSSTSETAADNFDAAYFGFVRKVKIVPLVYLETGLEFMAAGAKQSDDTKLQLNYLVIPAEAMVKIGPFVGLAGASANLRITEKLTVNGESIKRKKADRSSAFDFALNAGAGFNFLMFTLEGRYYWGLRAVEADWYNRYWQLGLKLNF